jgi:hypothetical protein
MYRNLAIKLLKLDVFMAIEYFKNQLNLALLILIFSFWLYIHIYLASQKEGWFNFKLVCREKDHVSHIEPQLACSAWRFFSKIL